METILSNCFLVSYVLEYLFSELYDHNIILMTDNIIGKLSVVGAILLAGLSISIIQVL